MPSCAELLAVFECAVDLGAEHILDIGEQIDKQRIKVKDKFEMDAGKLQEYDSIFT
jgi:hypothetical protein